MKIYLTLQKCILKTMMRYHYTSIRTAKIKTNDVLNASEHTKKLGPSCTTGGNVKWYIVTLEKFVSFFKN